MVQDMLENESRKCTEKALLHFGTSKIRHQSHLFKPTLILFILILHNTQCSPLEFCGNCVAGVNTKHIRSDRAENSEQPHRGGSGGTGHNFITGFVASEYRPIQEGEADPLPAVLSAAEGSPVSLSLCSLLSIQIRVGNKFDEYRFELKIL